MQRYLFLWFLLFLLVGCAGVNRYAEQDAGQLSKTHGLVHAVFPKVWGKNEVSLVLQSRENGNDYYVSKAFSDGSYLMWVPSGEYDIKELIGDKKDGGGAVEVKAGIVTDLGVLRRCDVGEYGSVLIAFDHPEFDGRVDKYIDLNKQYLRSRDPIVWRLGFVPKINYENHPYSDMGLVVDVLMLYVRDANKAPPNKSLREAKTLGDFVSAVKKTASPTIGWLTKDDVGNVYSGADFGQLRVRDVKGVWRQMDTGTTQPITAVYSDNGVLYAGTADGKIRVKASDSVWRMTHSVPDNESVTSLNRVRGRWFVVTEEMSSVKEGAVLLTNAVRLYSGIEDDFSDMKVVKKNISDGRAPFYSSAEVLKAVASENRFYFNSSNEIGFFDVSSMKWSRMNPGFDGVNSFYVSPGLGFVSAFKNQGVFSRLSYSEDDGKKWTDVVRPPYVVANVFLRSKTDADGSRWSAGMFTGSIEYIRYDQEKNEWKKIVNVAPGDCVRTLATQDGSFQFCVSRGGDIYRFDGIKLVKELVGG